MRIALTVGLAACAEETQGARAFVAADGDTFVAVVGDDASALAYVCDGAGDGASVSAWFSGAVDGDDFSLTGPAGTVAGTFGDTAIGEVLRTDLAPLAFTARSVPPDADDQGLFRAEGEVDGAPFVAGWILAPSGAQRGAVGLSTSSDLFGVVALPPGAEEVTLVIDGAAVDTDVFNAAAQFAE
jgi:hypothetical protein